MTASKPALPVLPDGGEGQFPVQEAVVRGTGERSLHHAVVVLLAFREQLDACLAEQVDGFEQVVAVFLVEQADPGLLVVFRFGFARPLLGLEKIQRALRRPQVIGECVHQCLGFVRFGDVDVSEVADGIHADARLFDTLQVVLLQQPPFEFAQLLRELFHLAAEQ